MISFMWWCILILVSFRNIAQWLILHLWIRCSVRNCESSFPGHLLHTKYDFITTFSPQTYSNKTIFFFFFKTAGSYFPLSFPKNGRTGEVVCSNQVPQHTKNNHLDKTTTPWGGQGLNKYTALRHLPRNSGALTSVCQNFNYLTILVQNCGIYAQLPYNFYTQIYTNLSLVTDFWHMSWLNSTIKGHSQVLLQNHIKKSWATHISNCFLLHNHKILLNDISL